MRILCAPNPAAIATDADHAFAMMRAPTDDGYGRVAVKIRGALRRAGITPDPIAWDFTILALGAIAADSCCLRSDSPDGWTRVIDLHVALREPSVWAPQVDALAGALQFLTGDMWTITVQGGGLSPLRRSRCVRSRGIAADCVCLLSGGVDSLVGAIDLASSGRTPVFISQVVRGDAARQSAFARAIGSGLPHVQLSHATQFPGKAEHSQRARSIIFLAFGLLAASALRGRSDSVELVVPENGFISYNVPLTPLRIGSLSTRTAHPFFLSQIQQIWDAVGLNVRIRNPYLHQTKGEMLAGCADQQLLMSQVFESTSCGRFGRFGYKHCGRCVPCLVRRAGFARWGVDDSTEYVHEDLRAERAFDDVRSVALACLRADADGTLRWCGNALSHEYVGDVCAAADLVERGLGELRALLEHAGVL